MRRSLFALNTLNFFMADVQAGLGPFLGVYLQARHWPPGEIGIVMTIGGIAGMAVTTPFGALVDRLRFKRAIIVAAAIVIALASTAVLWHPNFTVVTFSQVATGIGGAAIGPAIAAVTLGLVHQRGFAHQLGRNQAYNHAGNVAAAALAGLSGYLFGFGAVFLVLAIMAAFSVAATLRIDADEIDHRAARGAGAHDGDGGIASFAALLQSKPLIVLGATLTLFHLGNAAMLPLLGQALVARGAGNASAFTGATIVIAQITMVPAALIASWSAQRRGYWLIFLFALIALPIRGVIASLVTSAWGVWPVQVLDGVGAGILGVAVPGLVARILAGTGHVNAGLGAVMTLQGVGAALSTTVAGLIAQRFGYSTSFLTLGAIAALALILWLATHAIMNAACANAPSSTEAPAQAAA
jgi:MFS family permease